MNSILAKNVARLQPSARPAPGMRSACSQHWLNASRLRFYSMSAMICYVLLFAIYLYQAVWHPKQYINPLALDFLPFWSASHLALQGHAVDAYNFAVLEKIESGAISHQVGILPWLYPPTFFLFVYPLALLPWKVAAVAFLGCTYVLFAKAIHSIIPRREALFVSLAFPGAALVAASGQNGLLTASIAALGLAVLPRRPVVAGICFGLLSVKPHLAVLFPIALLCSRSWRAFASLTVTALGMLALAVSAFGLETLGAFVNNMDMMAGYVETGQAALSRIPSVFSLVRLLHGPTTLAYVAQGISALFAVAAVCYAWYREASHPLRAATLACASLMVSPYLFDYDLTWYGVVIAWWAKHAMEHGWKRGEREWLVLLWLMPFAGILVVTRVHFQFMPLIAAVTLWLLLKRIGSERCGVSGPCEVEKDRS